MSQLRKNYFAMSPDYGCLDYHLTLVSQKRRDRALMWMPTGSDQEKFFVRSIEVSEDGSFFKPTLKITLAIRFVNIACRDEFLARQENNHAP